MSLAETIRSITNKFNSYCGCILLIIGSIGALLNMYTYRQRTLRTSPCSIYLFSQSFFDLCHLINTLFTRILFTLSIETYSKNDFYCRIRSFIAEVTSLCAVSCLCLGTFDRCMFTSRQESLRRWSSHIFAYRSLTIIIIVWSLINIPQIIFRGITNNTCTSLSINFTLYLNYCHTPLFYGVIPITTLFYLRKRTIRNLQNLQHTVILRSRMERYINRMLLFQISLALFTFLLLMIQYIYVSVTIYTQKDALHTAIQNLSLQIVRLIFYLNYTSAFYINYFVSPEIRLIIRRLFTCKYQRIRPVNTIGRGEQH